jgi:hypothetical protein
MRHQSSFAHKFGHCIDLCIKGQSVTPNEWSSPDQKVDLLCDRSFLRQSLDRSLSTLFLYTFLLFSHHQHHIVFLWLLSTLMFTLSSFGDSCKIR